VVIPSEAWESRLIRVQPERLTYNKDKEPDTPGSSRSLSLPQDDIVVYGAHPPGQNYYPLRLAGAIHFPHGAEFRSRHFDSCCLCLPHEVLTKCGHSERSVGIHPSTLRYAETLG